MTNAVELRTHRCSAERNLVASGDPAIPQRRTRVAGSLMFGAMWSVERRCRAGVGGMLMLSGMLSGVFGLMVAASGASAQQYDPLSRSIPTGSPLGGSASSGQSQQTDGSDQRQSTVSPYPTAQRMGPTQIEGADPTAIANRDNPATIRAGTTVSLAGANATPPPPNEFERFVAQRLGRPLPRFGADLIVPAIRSYAVPTNTVVPASYRLSAGDEIFIGLTGSTEGSVTRQIDSNGRIFLPKVGSINLTGVAYGDLKSVIERAIAVRYRGFDVSVAVTRLRGFRVYVTGFANNPGAYTVDSLSTLVNAIFAAGGPSAGGSFRSVRLIRNGELVTDFDLYAFLQDGDRSRDATLQNGDVLSIPPLGPQVALTGSVNREAIFEAKPGETLNDLLRYAGGTSDLADANRLILYKLANAASVGAVEVRRDAYAAAPVSGGDVVQVLSTGTLATPLERQTVVVRIEGEVDKPGNYVVAPTTSLDQIVALAGGFTRRAYVFGTNLRRLSVRAQQRDSFQEAIRQLETSIAAAPLTAGNVLTADQSAQQIAAGRAVLERLRQAEPDGRIVLPVRPDGTNLPTTLALENNDTIYIPPRPVTVGVFGAVYRPASFLLDEARPLRVRDYIDQAGGTLRAADKRDIFVVHANGAVISKRAGALSERILPGDVIFVPTKTQNVSLLQKIAQITSILFSTGLNVAALAALSN